MNYILDTDTIIYFLGGVDTVVDKIISIPTPKLSTTIINFSELLYGAYNSNKISHNLKRVKDLIDQINLIPYSETAADHYAKTKCNLKKQGNIIADMDLMIASIAIVENAILVTNNYKHFKRIPKLKLENWVSVE